MPWSTLETSLAKSFERKSARSAVVSESRGAQAGVVRQTYQADALARSRRAVIQAIGAPSQQEMLAAKLTPVDGAPALNGASPKLLVQDQNGRRYLFKPDQPGSAQPEAESFAIALRMAAGEPTIPVVAQQVHLADGTVLKGRIKPFVKTSGNLAGSPSEWPAAHHDVLLADQAWAEVLGNYDTKKSQSVLLDTGLGQRVLNTDWDNALQEYRYNFPLTRFKQNLPVYLAPTAQSMLYRDYVHGAIDLNFNALFEAIDRIQKVPDAQVREAMQPYLAKAFANGGTVGAYTTPEALMRAVLERKATLKTKFQKLVSDLQTERACNLGQIPDPRSLKERVAIAAKDKRLRALDWFVSDTPYLMWKNQTERFIKAHLNRR